MSICRIIFVNIFLANFLLISSEKIWNFLSILNKREKIIIIINDKPFLTANSSKRFPLHTCLWLIDINYQKCHSSWRTLNYFSIYRIKKYYLFILFIFIHCSNILQSMLQTLIKIYGISLINIINFSCHHHHNYNIYKLNTYNDVKL